MRMIPTLFKQNGARMIAVRGAPESNASPGPASHRARARKMSRLAAATGLAAWAALATSCSPQAPAGGNARGPGGDEPIPVLATKAVATNVPVVLQAIGTVQAYSAVSIRSQLTGKIVSVHFHEGQEVRVGDPLFTLDARPWEAALNQAQANLERDKAQLLSARLEFERTSNLFATKIAAQSDYDTAEANYQAMQATLLADGAAITNAQLNLGYTEIRSPIEGRTGNLTLKAGNVVKSPDDILLSITQIHPIYVAFSVPEQQLPAIRRQDREAALPVNAVVPSEPDAPVQGRLTFINNMVDTNTGTILLKATFANTNNALWPGQFVQVSLTLSNLVNAIVVPSQAVQTGQHGEYLFVVTNQTAQMRPIVSGISYDGQTVIAGGLKAGETVVTDGQSRLAPGAKVAVKTAETAGLSGGNTFDSP